jgi:uncharacterized membrane protein YebE (DUF533 family)
MDAKELLEQVLESGKKLVERSGQEATELAQKGKAIAASGMDYAQQKFRLPKAGPERDQMLTTLGAGAAAGGILALLLNSRSGRRGLATVASLGSLAALGGLGYKIYSEYQKARGATLDQSIEEHLAEAHTNARCLTIVQAMIAAAKSDGVIDEQERKIIEDRIRESDLDPSVIDTLLAEISRPLVVSDVARLAKTPIDGVDIYLASLLVVDQPNESETKYLAELSNALDLDPALVRQLDTEAFKPI